MINAGIIGLDKMEISHLVIFNSHPHVNIFAVCSPSPFIKIFINK